MTDSGYHHGLGTMGSTGNVGGPSSSSSRRFEWLWVLLRFCNTFAVAILGACVVWIFLQLQYVNYTLNQESKRIDDVLTKIQQEQTEQIQELDQKVSVFV